MVTEESRADYYKMWANYQESYPDTFPSTWFELSWIREWNFSAERELEEPHHFNSFRRYFLACLTKFVSDRTTCGDLIEFGVFNGLGARVMLESSNKKLHLVDSFQGLSEPGPQDGNHWNLGDMDRSIEKVRFNLKKFEDRVVFHKGFIPDVLGNIHESGFSLAHVDLDLYKPTQEALDWLKSRMASNSFILCDDYGFETCPGATKACLEFVERERNWGLLPLAAGGCVFLNF